MKVRGKFYLQAALAQLVKGHLDLASILQLFAMHWRSFVELSAHESSKLALQGYKLETSQGKENLNLSQCDIDFSKKVYRREERNATKCLIDPRHECDRNQDSE